MMAWAYAQHARCLLGLAQVGGASGKWCGTRGLDAREFAVGTTHPNCGALRGGSMPMVVAQAHGMRKHGTGPAGEPWQPGRDG